MLLCHYRFSYLQTIAILGSRSPPICLPAAGSVIPNTRYLLGTLLSSWSLLRSTWIRACTTAYVTKRPSANKPRDACMHYALGHTCKVGPATRECMHTYFFLDLRVTTSVCILDKSIFDQLL
jgi:hypothetical protein